MTESVPAGRLAPSYDVVVVGAGNGGLSAALTLAMNGVKPLLLEQHNIPGGFATSFVRGRFEFDASLHQLADIGPESNKGALRKYLEDEAKLDVVFAEVPEAYRLILTDDGIDLRIPYGVDDFTAAFEKFEPGCGKKMKRYLELCSDVFEAIRFIASMKGRLDLPSIIQEAGRIMKTSKRPLGEISDTVTKVSNLFRTAAYSVDEVTDTFGFSERVKSALYPYWCYLGVPTSRLNFTIWAAMLIDYLERGGYVPKFRCQELTMAMERRIRELGGRVEYGTRVERINVKRGRVTGVETSAGDVIKTAQVISNASPTLVYNTLLHPAEEAPADAFRFVNARSHAVSGLTVFLGLDAPPDELGLEDYGYFVALNMDTDGIYESFGRLGLTDMQAACCLNLAVPDCSPPGTSILCMTTLYQPGVWDGVKVGEYVKVKSEIADAMIRQFEEGTGTNIGDHIEEIEVATPATFARYTRTYQGIIYGYECDPWDSVLPRTMAAKEESYIGGLEFVGGFGMMCHGYNTTITSGRVVAGKVLAGMGAAQ